MKCLEKAIDDPSRRERCDLWRHAWSTIGDNSRLSPTDHTVPYGTGFWIAHSRHEMPGYPHLVLPGQTHLRPYVYAYGQLPDRRPILIPTKATLFTGQDTKPHIKKDPAADRLPDSSTISCVSVCLRDERSFAAIWCRIRTRLDHDSCRSD
jgi:hypothetical protein